MEDLIREGERAFVRLYMHALCCPCCHVTVEDDEVQPPSAWELCREGERRREAFLGTQGLEVDRELAC